MATCQTAKEIAWMKSLVKELLNVKNVPTMLFMDNPSAISLIKNPVFHKRIKHIDVRFHYIRERYAKQGFALEHVASKEQHADIFTKPLPRQLYAYHREALGIRAKGHLREAKKNEE